MSNSALPATSSPSAFIRFRRDKAGSGINSNWGARPSRLRGRSHCVAAKARSPFGTFRCELSPNALGGTPDAACETRALPLRIIERRPLAPPARRAGWVGCNFALNRIPADARIALVITRSSGRESAPSSSGESGESQSRLTSAATIIVLPEEVRERFKRVKPLGEIKAKERGWTLDVLNLVRRISEAKRAEVLESGGMTPLSPDATCRVVPKRGHVRALQKEFTTSDLYAFTRELEKRHPDNRRARDKIHQQPQVLREAGFLIHIGGGE